MTLTMECRICGEVHALSVAAGGVAVWAPGVDSHSYEPAVPPLTFEETG